MTNAPAAMGAHRNETPPQSPSNKKGFIANSQTLKLISVKCRLRFVGALCDGFHHR
jgi:hypothetical protein